MNVLRIISKVSFEIKLFMQLITHEYETNIALIMSSINYDIFSKFKWQWVGHWCCRIDGLRRWGTGAGICLVVDCERLKRKKLYVMPSLSTSCINSCNIIKNLIWNMCNFNNNALTWIKRSFETSNLTPCRTKIFYYSKIF